MNEPPCPVGKIYTTIFSFFQKRVVNITISELRPVPNEKYSPNSPIFEILYHGLLNYVHTSTFLMYFKFLKYNFNFTEYSVKWKLQQRIFKKLCTECHFFFWILSKIQNLFVTHHSTFHVIYSCQIIYFCQFVDLISKKIRCAAINT